MASTSPNTFEPENARDLLVSRIHTRVCELMKLRTRNPGALWLAEKASGFTAAYVNGYLEGELSTEGVDIAAREILGACGKLVTIELISKAGTWEFWHDAIFRRERFISDLRSIATFVKTSRMLDRERLWPR